jgi:alkylation response protein AidB-like acyl-CoA dehydrogenase
LKTVAERIEVDGVVTGYRINGRKQWISNGSIADVATILARAPDGPSWFTVPRNTPGFSAGSQSAMRSASGARARALMQRCARLTCWDRQSTDPPHRPSC